MTKAFIWDKDTPNEKKTNSDETNELLKEIRSEIEKDERRLIYSHEVCSFLFQPFKNYDV
jgi:hypothetical protein